MAQLGCRCSQWVCLHPGQADCRRPNFGMPLDPPAPEPEPPGPPDYHELRAAAEGASAAPWRRRWVDVFAPDGATKLGWFRDAGDALFAEVARRDVPALLEERDRLAAEVYVPGQWRCPKCSFHLTQSVINAATGAVGFRDDPGEKCPNCHTPLWRVTERQAGNELVDRWKESNDRAEKAEAALERATMLLRPMAGISGAWDADEPGVTIVSDYFFADQEEPDPVITLEDCRNAQAFLNDLAADKMTIPDLWRPMDTAPKDGTRFLAWVGGGVVTITWAAEIRGGVWWVNDGHADGYPTGREVHPTAWMPYPPAPTPETVGAKP